jgi:hypothetical protein
MGRCSEPSLEQHIWRQIQDRDQSADCQLGIVLRTQKLTFRIRPVDRATSVKNAVVSPSVK